jgi:pilus assembly protein Flp/PilA
MNSLKTALIALWKDEEGLTMVEYAIAGALIAAGAAVAFSDLGKAVSTQIMTLSSWVSTGSG